MDDEVHAFRSRFDTASTREISEVRAAARLARKHSHLVTFLSEKGGNLAPEGAATAGDQNSAHISKG